MSVRLDGVEVLLTWAHTVWGDFKSCKLNSVSSEHELVWMEDDAVVSAKVQPVNCLGEAVTEII